MNPYLREPDRILQAESRRISSFIPKINSNIDRETVDSFGEEWTRFSEFDPAEISRVGEEYFDLMKGSFTGNELALDLGCGSGRWSAFVAPKVGFIEAVDPSSAVFIASKMLKDLSNVRVTQCDVDSLPFADNSFDLIFSLGVLHHIPDTAAAIQTAVKKLKPGGKFLLYLYYRFDNRGLLFRTLFSISDVIRKVICRLPHKLKVIVCDIIAVVVYLPLVSIARFVKFLGGRKFYTKLPLAYYVNKSFYIMRNDALDRFGTPLEQRFTREEIRLMLENAGMNHIRFSPNEPYWHVIAEKS
jgi:SAM-dependent methyltransferase